MKAAIFTKCGPSEVVEIQERRKPTPKSNEILIRVITATIQTADCKVMDLIDTAKLSYNPVIKLLM